MPKDDSSLSKAQALESEDGSKGLKYKKPYARPLQIRQGRLEEEMSAAREAESTSTNSQLRDRSDSSDPSTSVGLPRGQGDTQNSPGVSSLFHSASNIDIAGGQFNLDSTNFRNNTNLTINLHQGAFQPPQISSGNPLGGLLNRGTLHNDPTSARLRHGSDRGAFQPPPIRTEDLGQNTFTPAAYMSGLYNDAFDSNPFQTTSFDWPMRSMEGQFPSVNHIQNSMADVYPFGTYHGAFQPSQIGTANMAEEYRSMYGAQGDTADRHRGGPSREREHHELNACSNDTSHSLYLHGLKKRGQANQDDSALQPTSISQDSQAEPEMLMQKSSDIYYRHLSVKQRGYPLWIPEPNCYLPIQYQRKGISIGDVGIITASGSFDYLFNVFLAHDHPFNVGRVPLDFTPFFPPLDSTDIRGQLEFRTNSYIASASVKRTLGNDRDAGTTFEISASEGAILTIPDGALSEDLGNLARLRQYMGVNVESWYRHANGPRGREVENGDLRLVIGCDKTTAWGMAAFSNLSQEEDTRLKFKPMRHNPRIQTYGWELHSGTAEVRSGPDAREIQALSDGEHDGHSRPYENQCLFVRTMNATLHDDAWNELVSELSVPSADAGTSNHKFSDSGISDSVLQQEDIHSQQSNEISGPSQPEEPGRSQGTNNLSNSIRIPHRVTVHKPDVPTYLASHPSKSINTALLQQHMDAKIAITEDSNWSSVLTANDIVMPIPRYLTERVLANHTPIQDVRGIIYLEKNIPTPYESRAPLYWPSEMLPNDDIYSAPRIQTACPAPMRNASNSPSSM